MSMETTTYSDKKKLDLFNQNIPNILNLIQSQEGNFEADTLEDFYKGNFYVLETKKFPTWLKKNTDISSYFQDIVNLAKKINEGTEKDVSQLEKWLLTKSCRINIDNFYILTPMHPMIQLIEETNKELDLELAFLETQQTKMEFFIKKLILENYKKIKENFSIYAVGNVYQCLKIQDYWQAVAWEDYGTITSVDAISLIDKIVFWLQNHWDGIEKNPSINIAYIGSLYNQNEVVAYFSKYPIVVNNIEVFPKITFTKLQKKEYEQRIFVKQNEDIESKNVYDFQSIGELKTLFQDFDIVLFLDESYFYKQRQCPKDLGEKGALELAKWFWGKFNTESKKIEEREKYYYFYKIYKNIGLWLNGRMNEKSSQFSFDYELFSTIQNAYHSKCDVYLYISQGNSIKDIKLENQFSCVQENHSGQNIMVYKIAKNFCKEAINEDIVSMANKCENIATMSVFDLVNRIDFSLIPIVFKSVIEEDQNIAEKINILKNTVLTLTLQRTNSSPLQLIIQVGNSSNHFAKKFVEALVNLYREENKFPYIKNYLHQCFCNEFLLNANSIEGLFIVNLLKKGKIDLPLFIHEIDIPSSLLIKNENRIYARNLIYNMISKLDSGLLIRDLDKLKSILLYEFRFKFNLDIMDDTTFWFLLDEINNCCEDNEYTDSNVYRLIKHLFGNCTRDLSKK